MNNLNLQHLGPTLAEAGRLALALAPYILLSVLVATMAAPDLWPLPWLPLGLSIALPKSWPGRLVIWFGGCVVLIIWCYAILGDGPTLALLAASVVRGYNAVT